MGYLGVSCFLLLKPFHMILFGPVPPDGEVSPDSHETETERQLQSKTEDRPGGAGGQGVASVASGFRGTSLALVCRCFCVADICSWGRGTVDISRFHGGPILAVTQPFMRLGAWYLLVPSSVSAFRGVAGSVGMQIEDAIAGTNAPSAGNCGWEMVVGWV